MIWVLSLLALLVLCLIGAVVTLWQNLERAIERIEEVEVASPLVEPVLQSHGRQIDSLDGRVREMEAREQSRLQTSVGNPNVGYMETLAEKVRSAGPMAGPWTNPVAERHPEIQP